MKLKKLIILFLAILSCFLIFKFTFNNKLDYLALGDDLSKGKTPFNTFGNSFTDYFAQYLQNKKKLKSYNNLFLSENYRTTDLIKDIKYSKEIESKKVKININQAIANADVITISIGMSDILYKLNENNLRKSKISATYAYIDEIFWDIEILLATIRNINDCDIYLIGFYNIFKESNPIIKNIYEYFDKMFKELENTNKIYYIDIDAGFNNKTYYKPNYRNPYPSLEGYNYIANKVIDKFEEKY